MVVSMAPGPPTGFSTHPGGFTTGNLLSSGFTSVDIPPSDQRNSNNGNPPNGMHEYGVTHLSGARMHLKLPQRQRDTSLLDEGYSPSPITTTPETVHRRSSSIMARARAQTVSDQTDLRNYPSISSIAPDSVDNEEHETAGPSMNGQQPHVLTAHPTPSISSSSSKRQIITLDTNSNALQSLDPSLSGLGWEDPSGSRPESPLPLPSPMPHVDDQPGSKSIFCTGSRSNASSQEAGKAGVPSTSRSTEAERKASKTSAFFSVSFGDEIPTPPRPLRESEIKEKTINAMSSCPSLHEQASQMPGSQTASSTTTSRASRNSIFDTADGSTVLPTRNRQRSGLGLGTSPARRVESSHLHEGTSATTPENEEPVFSEFSSFSARRATLAAAGVNRARSLNETTRRKSNAIFGESHALLPPSRAPPSNLSTIQRPLQDLPSPVGTFAAYTISPSPSPSTGTFGDRLNMNERSSSLRTTILGIPDSRAVTMPFPANAPNAPPSSASSTLPISPVESTSSIVDNPTRSTVLPLQPPPNSLLSPPKRLTREVSNSNCSDSSTADALPDKINVKPGDILEPEDRSKEGESPRVIHAWKVEKVLGEGAFSRVWSARSVTLSKGKGKETETDASTDAVETGSDVVAIKMMDKRICKDNDRTRISFEREVAVLKRISHPQIVEYKSSFSTRYFNCLVLEQVTGGELFDLLQQRGNHRRMGEDFLRRVFTELCRGVYWLHCANVVHRDLKLENIMFTINPFDLVDRNDPNAKIPIDALPPQLVKLTDFGLARFIDPASPRLETRCGSESFAAPEIIMGLSYDGRDTDAWAVGVILFALVTCELPFDRTSERNGSGLSHRSAHHTPDDDDASRRKQLMRIARGAYDWPTGKGSEGVKRVVAKLLVRDPARRSRIDRALWDEIWMNGPGSLPAPEAYDPSAPAIFEGGGRRRLLDGYVIDSETMDLSV